MPAKFHAFHKSEASGHESKANNRTESRTKKNSIAENELSPLILAIDTSCDETSAAVTLGRVVLANIIASQAEIHRPYGGVFPDLAKQAHQENIRPTIQAALNQAQIDPEQLDAIAITQGPGLAPALEIGLQTAKQLSREWHKPVIAVNHLEAHLVSVWAHRRSRNLKITPILDHKNQSKKADQSATKQNSHTSNSKELDILEQFPNSSLDFFNQQIPALGLIVSGGHSQFVQINNFGNYQILGKTIDDAAGEALDKVGRMLNLGYPAGPVIEKLAKEGNPEQFEFPLPMTTVKNFNLSYSGLKTSAHRLVSSLKTQQRLDKQTIIDLAASFQAAVFRHLEYKLDKLLQELQPRHKFNQLWLGGGVARNIELRRRLRAVLRPYQIRLLTPFEKRLCSDNAAMIGLAANYHWRKHAVNKKSRINNHNRTQKSDIPNHLYTPTKTSNYPAKNIKSLEHLDRKPNWNLEEI